MIFAVDVDYREGKAVAAGIAFNNWEDHTPNSTFITQTDQVEEYQPGEFYKREMSIILLLLETLPQLPKIIVIDGYVYLDRHQKTGLGYHLYNCDATFASPLNPVAISARFTVFTRISAIRNVDTNASLAAFHCRWCCNISRNRLISLIGVLFAMWLSFIKPLPV
jgi:hypothetical protein